MLKQIGNFVLHLRLNYNFLILSAPFLLGAFYVSKIINVYSFLYLFVVAYIFLFGGVNAYNSYFDKDEGPIGGLEKPPKMEKWMLVASWCFQIAGLALSLWSGYIYTVLVIMTIFLSWLYSGMKFRFKGRPILSLITIGIGIPLCMTFMGYIAAGGNTITTQLILGAIGSALIIMSMYPFSQVYQIADDEKRGDITFTVRYGATGVKRIFYSIFPLGIILLSLSFSSKPLLSIMMIAIGSTAYIAIWGIIKNISGIRSEYKIIMNTKYYSGIAFTLAIILLLMTR